MIFQTIILFWLSHKSMAANTAYNLFRIQGYSIYLDSKLLIFCNVIFICQKLWILLISNSLLSFRTWGLNWLTILRIAGFFSWGGSPHLAKILPIPPSDTCPRFWTKACPPQPRFVPENLKILNTFLCQIWLLLIQLIPILSFPVMHDLCMFHFLKKLYFMLKIAKNGLILH